MIRGYYGLFNYLLLRIKEEPLLQLGSILEKGLLIWRIDV